MAAARNEDRERIAEMWGPNGVGTERRVPRAPFDRRRRGERGTETLRRAGGGRGRRRRRGVGVFLVARSKCAGGRGGFLSHSAAL
jgi:hypothetical protein